MYELFWNDGRNAANYYYLIPNRPSVQCFLMFFTVSAPRKSKEHDGPATTAVSYGQRDCEWFRAREYQWAGRWIEYLFLTRRDVSCRSLSTLRTGCWYRVLRDFPSPIRLSKLRRSSLRQKKCQDPWHPRDSKQYDVNRGNILPRQQRIRPTSFNEYTRKP